MNIEELEELLDKIETYCKEILKLNIKDNELRDSGRYDYIDGDKDILTGKKIVAEDIATFILDAQHDSFSKRYLKDK